MDHHDGQLLLDRLCAVAFHGPPAWAWQATWPNKRIQLCGSLLPCSCLKPAGRVAEGAQIRKLPSSEPGEAAGGSLLCVYTRLQSRNISERKPFTIDTPSGRCPQNGCHARLSDRVSKACESCDRPVRRRQDAKCDPVLSKLMDQTWQRPQAAGCCRSNVHKADKKTHTGTYGHGPNRIADFCWNCCALWQALIAELKEISVDSSLLLISSRST